MGKRAGLALKALQTMLYMIEFCCAAIVLGIFSYFLAVLARRDIPIPTWEKAVEGLAGAAVLYLLFAIILTIFLGGKTFFAALGVLFDLLFCGAFIAIAVMTRHGASSCDGIVNTPLGTGDADLDAPGTGDYGYVCTLNTVCFAVSIIALTLFLISAILQIMLARNHRKEKRFGPGPNNDYTSGSGPRRFWQRKDRTEVVRDTEFAAVPAGGLVVEKPAHNAMRPSGDTAYTGSTMAAPVAELHGAHQIKYAPGAQAIIPTANGSHAYDPHHPTGTAVNPYGYDNTRGNAGNF